MFPYRRTKEEKSDDGGRLSRTPGQDEADSLLFLRRSSDICGGSSRRGFNYPSEVFDHERRVGLVPAHLRSEIVS